MGSNRISEHDHTRNHWLRAFVLTILAIALISSGLFGARTFGSYRLLRSATAIGAPNTSTIRAWMTLDYVGRAYGVPSKTLAERLQLPSDTNPQLTVKALADAKSFSRIRFAQEVQRAVAQASPVQKPIRSDGWLSTISDAVLSAVASSGYFALAATFMLGAFGLPVPNGVAAILAGSLAAQGRLELWALLPIGIAASTIGDFGDFLVGRAITPALLTQHGRWIGLTVQRRAFIIEALATWGTAAILLSRTLAGSVSMIVSILAGAARYSAPRFLSLALLGRILWTSAYIWLGYTVGRDLDAAASFLLNLTGLLLSLFVFAAACAIWIKTAYLHVHVKTPRLSSG